MSFDEVLDIIEDIDDWADRFKIDVLVPCSIMNLNCPQLSVTVLDLIFHFNDDHNFSFNKIADLLERLGINVVIE